MFSIYQQTNPNDQTIWEGKNGGNSYFRCSILDIDCYISYFRCWIKELS